MTEGVILAEECEAGFFDWVGQGTCKVTDAISDGAGSFLELIYNLLVSGSTWAVEWTGKAWLDFPEPTIGTSAGTPSDNISQLWSLGSFYVLGIAIIGFLVAVVRLMASPSMQSAGALLRGIALIIAVQTVGIGASVLLLDAGNKFSTWVVEEAGGDTFETALADFSGLGGVTSIMLADNAMDNVGPIVAFAVVGFVLLLLAAFAQICLLIVRSALLVILMAFLPFLAAASFTSGGYKALSRAVGWIFALILYKPVAGIIYAVGILTLKNAADEPTMEEQMLNLLIGVVIVGAAALALPALIKFVAPQAAAGASMAFSGGAVAAGAIGTGAAVVSMGAGAAGAGAAGAGAGASGAGAGASGAGAAKEGASTGEGKPSGSSDTGKSSGDGSESGNGQGSGSPTATGASDSKPSGKSEGVTDTAPAGGDGDPPGDAPAEPSGAPGGSGKGQSSAPAGGGDTPTSTSGDDSASGGPDGDSDDSGNSGGPSGSDDAPAPTSSADGGSTPSGGDGDTADGANADSSSDDTAEGAQAPSGPPPAAPSGSHGTHRADIAGSVRDAAKGAKSGADDVDFNEGQEDL